MAKTLSPNPALEALFMQDAAKNHRSFTAHIWWLVEKHLIEIGALKEKKNE